MSSQVGKSVATLGKELVKHETGPKQVVKHIGRRLPPLLSLSDLLRLYKVRAKKHLSQNFLLNPRVCRRFVQLARVKEGQTIVEIGPGPGNITRYLLERNPREIYLIEKDRRFLPCLEMLADAAAPGQVKVMLGDVMDYTLDGLLPPDVRHDWNDIPPPIHVIGNLPFNIAGALTVRLMRQMYHKTGLFAYGRVRMSLTFQLEVAQRIVAPVLDEHRSRLSVMCQNVCDVKLVQKIKGASFTPAPEVDVGVVNFVPLKEPIFAGVQYEIIEKFVKEMFHLRRAFLKKPLGKLFPPEIRYLVLDLFKKAQINPDARALMLDMEEIGRLLRAYSDFCQEIPGLFEYDHRQPRNNKPFEGLPGGVGETESSEDSELSV